MNVRKLFTRVQRVFTEQEGTILRRLYNDAEELAVRIERDIPHGEDKIDAIKALLNSMGLCCRAMALSPESGNPVDRAERPMNCDSSESRGSASGLDSAAQAQLELDGMRMKMEGARKEARQFAANVWLENADRLEKDAEEMRIRTSHLKLRAAELREKAKEMVRS